MSVAADPATCDIPVAGGTSTHALINSCPKRVAFKVRTSNNKYYRIKPVFGFIESGHSSNLEVTRLPGGPDKADRLHVVYVEVSPDVKVAEKALQGSATKQFIVPLGGPGQPGSDPDLSAVTPV
ncbi:hypothetical protein PRIPAC_89221 [Pristionchus pacificus]|uniref:Major sperm protein n=1 Tax=Pristionchus pacificus TaxID=54126 RepID=A0A454Y111_PRIPA|nr:hypothetical protein PRIPAC_89221 [Pristionchus pacificus]|eukprot:PDM83283.1 MSP domain-containing protein [Pristionchus pacificus]